MSDDNPYPLNCRTAKGWGKAFLGACDQMASAIEAGDWAAAKGWATIASWQFERMQDKRQGGVRPS